MKKFTKIMAMLLALATLISTIPFSVSAAGWSLQVATSLEEGKDNYAYALSDYDRDGIEDLFCFKLRNAASKTLEVHILSGSSNFSTFILHTATILGEPGNAFKLIVHDVNSDGFSDVIALKVRGCESSKTEIHILNGADGYKSWLLQKAIPLNEALDNCSFSFANIDNGNVPDLYITKFNNTGSGNVEVHVLSGESNYSEFVLRTSIPLGQTDSSKFRFGVGHFNGAADSINDLYCLKVSDVDSGRLEVHVLNGHNSFQTFLSHQATILAADNKNFEYLLGTYKGSPALYCIKKQVTSSNRTEVHVFTIDGAQLPSQKTTIWPVGGSVYTDQNNWVNYKTNSDYHSGTDISAPKGAPVYATYDGVVDTALNLNTSYGCYVVVKCQVNGETVYIYYAHLNKRYVKKGDVVKAGQQIGEVGSTGKSSGPHLHYEVRNKDKWYGNKAHPTLNPYDYLPDR